MTLRAAGVGARPQDTHSGSLSLAQEAACCPPSSRAQPRLVQDPGATGTQATNDDGVPYYLSRRVRAGSFFTSLQENSIQPH